MSVYLGTFGEVELKREFDGSDLQSTINPSDVNATKKRFSFDFDHGQLLTGDQVEITSTDGSALDFIDSYTKTSVKKFIYVDELDGIRLYDTFAHAVVGGTTNATALATPGNNIPIKVVVQNSEYRVLGRVQSYELNTQRETVDVTTLSDEFRNRIGTLMSGSGRMACEWEYTGDTAKELPNYLLELVLRTKVGSTFKGRFYIKTSGYNPANHSDANNDAVWYEVSGVLTACAVQFTPNQMVQITADFITTSKIEIRMDLEVQGKLLQENTDDILLEQGTTDAVLLEST
jgi:hypothetical protein|tara:strand:+ start:812 stop:1678 length:867 start_codon:yes stop_codon:yes gene_type:complete